MDLLWIVDGKKDSKVIFDILIIIVKTWGLDMNKCVGFGLDGATTMVGKNTNIVSLLKKVNPFLTSIHCVAYKTNLVVLEASKNESCKDKSSKIDSMMNTLASYFNKSCKRKSASQAL